MIGVPVGRSFYRIVPFIVISVDILPLGILLTKALLL